MPSSGEWGIIGAGLGLAGGVYSAWSAKREAEKNREFQERMSSTAHQREIEDLKKAGLNPALSAHGGASSPSGSMPSLPDLGESMSRGINSGLMVQRAKAEIGLLKAQTDSASASAVKTNQEAETGFAMRGGQLDLQRAEILIRQADAEQVRQMMPVLLQRAKAEAKSSEQLALIRELSITRFQNLEKFESQIKEMGPWFRLLLESVRTFAPGERVTY